MQHILPDDYADASQQQHNEVVRGVEDAEAENRDQDPNQWDCQFCTFKNTVLDWSDMTQSRCEACGKTNEAIRDIMQMQSQGQYVSEIAMDSEQ